MYNLYWCIIKNQYRGFKNWAAWLYLTVISFLSVLLFFIATTSFQFDKNTISIQIRSFVVDTVLLLIFWFAIHYAYEQKLNKDFFILLPLSATQVYIMKALADFIAPKNGIILSMVIAFSMHFASNGTIFILSLGYYIFILFCVSIWLTNIFELLNLFNLQEIIRFFWYTLFLALIYAVVRKIDLDKIITEHVKSFPLPISLLEGLLRSSSVPVIFYLRDTLILMLIFILGIIFGRFITSISLKAS